MRVTRLSYGPASGGVTDGTMRFYLALGGPGSLTPSQAVDIITQQNRTLMPKVRAITVMAESVEREDDDEVAELLHVLRENGFLIRVELLGFRRPMWIDIAHTRVVSLGNEPWIRFAANEIHYLPPQGEPLKEPDIGEANIQSYLYICAYWKIPGDQLLAFTKNATHIWGIIVPPVRQYEIVLYESQGVDS